MTRLTFLIVVLTICPVSHLCAQDTNGDGLLESATAFVRNAYGSRANGMVATSKGMQAGVIVSVEIPKSPAKARYWVICEEVTSVSGRVPERKWKRICCIGIEGPKYDGGWIRELTDAQYEALLHVTSPTDVSVTDKVLASVIRDMVLPGNGPGFETDWHRGSFFVRAATAFVYQFEFRTQTSRGGNLVGVTLYLDGSGAVITKSEWKLLD